MTDVVLKSLGIWILAIIETGIAAGSYLIGHFINTIPAEIAVFVASMLGATQILLFALIKYYFKLTDEDIENRAKIIQTDKIAVLEELKAQVLANKELAEVNKERIDEICNE